MLDLRGEKLEQVPEVLEVWLWVRLVGMSVVVVVLSVSVRLGGVRP